MACKDCPDKDAKPTEAKAAAKPLRAVPPPEDMVYPLEVVNRAEDVKAGCVLFPLPQPVILGCPHCGARMEFLSVDGMITHGPSITIPAYVKFPCGWEGRAINGKWIEKTHHTWKK